MRWARVVLALAGLATLASLEGCAALSRRRPPGVPIEQRPTPVARADTTLEQPPPADTSKPATSPSGATSKNEAPPPAPRPSVESVMTPAERKEALGQIVADTTSASAAVKRCASRSLLPDQESVYETTLSLLAQTRAALARDEVWRAGSLARKARQLASSLDCP